MSKKNELDQYYTNPVIAKECLDILKNNVNCKNKKFLEPSAGDGAFANLLKSRIALDLEPKIDNCIQTDFFTTTRKSLNLPIPSKIITIGNPPFGWASSLAIKFFNHATTLSNTIAFIIPKTFRKASIQNKLNMNFHLIVDTDITKNAFLLHGKEYDVPCCFQIWVKKLTPRQPVKAPDNIWFQFTDENTGSFSIRRVGGRAGQVLKGTDYNTNTTYFIEPLIDKKTLIQKLKSIDFTTIVNNTAGVRSISQDEIVIELAKVMT